MSALRRKPRSRPCNTRSAISIIASFRQSPGCAGRGRVRRQDGPARNPGEPQGAGHRDSPTERGEGPGGRARAIQRSAGHPLPGATAQGSAGNPAATRDADCHRRSHSQRGQRHEQHPAGTADRRGQAVGPAPARNLGREILGQKPAIDRQPLHPAWPHAPQRPPPLGSSSSWAARGLARPCWPGALPST